MSPAKRYQTKIVAPRTIDCPKCGKPAVLEHLGSGCFQGDCKCGLEIRGSSGEGHKPNDGTLTLVTYPVDFGGIGHVDDGDD